MNFPRWILPCAVALAVSVLAPVSSAQPDFLLHATPVGASPPDPAIAGALKAIEPKDIEKTIQTLVGFGTRNTLSSMETDLPPGQGVTAAADWITANSSPPIRATKSPSRSADLNLSATLRSNRSPIG